MVFYLIDGNSFCYRAFHAVRELRNSKGAPTNVVFGFCSMMKKLIEDFAPDGIAVAFDSKGPTFRHKKFEDYKSHRKPMPDDLALQMPVVKDLVRAFNVPMFELQGYEADDLLGTMAAHISAAGHKTVIVTSDKDMFQLVDEKVSVLNPQKDYAFYDPVKVKEFFGVRPDQVVDILALMGDSSDYIPGVSGIGQKSAHQLIEDFGDLKGVYRNLDKIKREAQRKSLEDNRKDAELSYELATIDRKVPIDIRLEDLASRKPDAKALRDLYKELEFRSLLKAMPGEFASDKNAKEYRLVKTVAAWNDLLKKLEASEEFAFDFETTGIDALLADPVGISFAIEPHVADFVLFACHASGQSLLEAAKVLGDAKKLFENPSIKKTGQNLKYEITLLRRYGIRLAGMDFDTMIGSYLLNSAKRNHNLSELAFEYLDEKLIETEELIGKGKTQITMAEVSVEKLAEYGCQDSDVALRLTRILRPKILEKGMTDLLQKMELPLVEVLAEMESVGIAIDKKLLAKLSEELGEAIDELTRKIHKLADSDFNINSPKQLAEVLFVKLGLQPLRKTKSGFSTDVDVLTQLADSHRIPALVLEYRELSKLKSTYVDTMPQMTNPHTGRIHSSFNQTVAETGRLSSNDPNLQNIPVRTEEGRKIRKAFVAEKGKLLLSADYSQIELRVLAHFSGDEALGRAFVEGVDIHRHTAGLIFGVPSEEVTAKMRESAKTVNFGVTYGMGAFSLAKQLSISQEAARDFIKSYFDRYPKVKGFLDRTIESAKKNGYVETLFKRRRYIPDILSSDARMRQYAERMAINAPVQGTASDLIKLAMVALHRDMTALKGAARMLLQVHDELVFEVEKDALSETACLVKKDMEQTVKLSVPVEVTLKAGPNWCDMERLAV